jgi:hypothetical protein
LQPIDPLQILAWVAAAVAALAAVGTLGYNFKARREDRYWEKMKKAESLISDIYSNDYAHYALRMIDGSLVQLPLLPEFQTEPPLKVVTLSQAVVRDALLTDMDEDEDKPIARSICHCFDTLFYQLNRLEVHIAEDLVDFEHVRWQLAYYMACLARSDGLFETYIDAIAYPRVKNLISRFV